MIIEIFLAIRFLREGRGQSLLILAGVAVGVAVMVFLSALIDGLQQRIIGQTLGTQAHVVVRMPEEIVRPLLEPDEGQRIARVVQEPAQRTRSIVGWQRHLEAIERMPGVEAVSATVSGPGFALRGAASRSIVLFGVDPARYDTIYAVSQHMHAGAFAPSGTEAVIGIELAADLGVEVGDRIRIATAGDREQTFRIAGIFDLGNRDVNKRWAIVSLRAGQTMLDLVGGTTSIDVRVHDVFAADEVAGRIGSRTGLSAESWMQTNQQLMVALRSQSSSSQTIQAFVILAVAMGIASVLVVSVVQKQREIGILRAMGLSRQRVLRVFLVQGLVVGLLGSSVGSAMGAGLVIVFANAARNPDGSPLFLLRLEPPLFVTATVLATLVGLLAAVWPARRAARLDPAEAIRHV
ncbi:MAG: ABC transporter permease [Sandaracinaceae bacterium]|nr:ABC transporter permease [Sandaracinaceae bacterium]